MSNDIYSILKKMQNLETPKKSLTESKKAKPDYIDIDKDGNKEEPMKKAAKDKSKGAIAEAVAKVESQLNEKYMGFKKTVSAIKKGGSAENPEAVAAAIGRKKYGKAKFQKAAAAGKKLGEDDYSMGGEGPDELLMAVEDEISEPGMSFDNLVDALNGTFGSSREPKFKKARALINRYLELIDSAETDDIEKYIRDYNLVNYLQRAADNLNQVIAASNKKLGEDDFQTTDPKEIGAKINPAYVSPAAKAAGPGPASTAPAPKAISVSTTQVPDVKFESKIHDLGETPESAGIPKTAKQKKFAKLAPPPDKITYADKIAGAKKTMREGWEEMQKYLEKKRGPESKGGEGKKAGTRYGGSAQKDDDEDLDGEGNPVEKKKGRPKGTGGGAKHSFKKLKD